MKQTKYYGFRFYGKGQPVKEVVTQSPIQKNHPPIDVLIAEAINVSRTFDFTPMWAELKEVTVNEAGQAIGFLPATLGDKKPHAFIFEEHEGEVEVSGGVYFVRGERTGAVANEYEINVAEILPMPI